MPVTRGGAVAVLLSVSHEMPYHVQQETEVFPNDAPGGTPIQFDGPDALNSIAKPNVVFSSHSH